MAEIICKVGQGSTYEDGDILCAFNNTHIKYVHANHICKPIGFNSSGLRSRDTLAEVLFVNTSLYRFERVSNSVKRTNLITNQIDIFDQTPQWIDGKYQSIDVERFLQRRINQSNHNIFGVTGSEVWYGGNRDIEIDSVWERIEDETNHNRSQRKYQIFPLTERELIAHLAIAVDDFDYPTAGEVTGPELDENEEVIKRRRFYTSYCDVFPNDVSCICCKETLVDLRDNEKIRVEIVADKRSV